MNTTPSALSSYGPAGCVLILLQWYLATRFNVTMPNDVALAAAGLLGHIVDTLRQTPRVQAWFVARPATPATLPPAIVEVMKQANDALAKMEAAQVDDPSTPVVVRTSLPNSTAFPKISDIPGLAIPPGT